MLYLFTVDVLYFFYQVKMLMFYNVLNQFDLCCQEKQIYSEQL